MMTDGMLAGTGMSLFFLFLFVEIIGSTIGIAKYKRFMKTPEYVDQQIAFHAEQIKRMQFERQLREELQPKEEGDLP